MTRERFLQLCERAAELYDVCAEVTITMTKCNGDVITMTLKDNSVVMTGERSQPSTSRIT